MKWMLVAEYKKTKDGQNRTLGARRFWIKETSMFYEFYKRSPKWSVIKEINLEERAGQKSSEPKDDI